MENISLQITSIFEDLFDGVTLNSIDYGKELTDLGIDSMGFIHLVVAIEEHFLIEIPDEFLVLSKMNTVKKIISVIEELLL